MLLCADSTTRSRNTWHTELHFLWKGRYGVTKFDRLFLSWNKKFPSRIWNFVHWTCVLLWTTCITVYEYKKEKLSCYFSTATKAFFIIVQAAYVTDSQPPGYGVPHSPPLPPSVISRTWFVLADKRNFWSKSKITTQKETVQRIELS